MARMSARRWAIVMAACVVLGCGSEDNPTAPGPVSEAPDVALVDVNPNSSRHDESVSPRDYLGQVSAWYFGHAT